MTRRGGRNRGFIMVPAAMLLLALAAGGCSRVPKIIVLKDPLTAPEHVELGVAYERKGEYDLAVREYEAALRKDKGFVQARINLGNVYLAKKEYGKARAEYLDALEKRPGDPEAANNLAWTAILSGEGIGESLARMETVTAGPGGRRATFLDTLGVLRMRSNRPAEAEIAFTEAETLCGWRGGAEPRGTPADPSCTGELQREIISHREELRKSGAHPAIPPPLLK